MEGSYRFDTLSNGISIHGGTVTARCDFCSSRLAEPYVSFVLLLEGRLDFGINRRRFRIDADGSKIVLIAVGEEVLFSRYLYRGGKTVKMTIKGMEQWLPRPEYARFAPCFTANRSGYGICPKPARLGGILPANRPKGAFGRNIAPRGGRVAAAVGFVGHGFRRHRAMAGKRRKQTLCRLKTSAAP